MKTTFDAERKCRVKHRETGEFGQWYHAKVGYEINGQMAVFLVEFVLKENDGAIEKIESGQIQYGTPWRICDPDMRWADGTPTAK